MYNDVKINIEDLNTCIGKKLYYDCSTIITIEKFLNDKNGVPLYAAYTDNNYFDGRNNFRGMMTIEDLKKTISNQETIKKDYEENVLFTKSQEEKARVHNNIYGFIDDKPPMQQGKIKKTLYKLIRYKYEIMERIDFIILLVKNGYNPVYYEKDKTYRAYDNENYSFIELLKTEYDFMKYLIENNVNIDF